MPFSSYARDKIIDLIHGKTAFSLPQAFAALCSAITPASGTELSYTGYARIATVGADWSASSGGAGSNANAITFAQCTAGTGTARYVAFFDALTSGNLLSYAPLVGVNTYKPIVSVTRSSSTATFTVTGHGYSNGDEVDISGWVQSEYNGNFVISNVAANTFDVTVTGTPTTPGTFDLEAPQVVKLSVLAISTNVTPQIAAAAHTDKVR